MTANPIPETRSEADPSWWGAILVGAIFIFAGFFVLGDVVAATVVSADMTSGDICNFSVAIWASTPEPSAHPACRMK